LASRRILTGRVLNPRPVEQKETEPDMEHKERFKKVAKMWADAPEVRPAFLSFSRHALENPPADAYSRVDPPLQNPKNKAA
jgi:hypothetical protein